MSMMMLLHLINFDILTSHTAQQAFIDDLQNSVNISLIFHKVRIVVQMYRKSPLTNDFLQMYVKCMFLKELMLILGVKTRWNSLVAILERFLELKACILKAIIHFKRNSQYLRRRICGNERNNNFAATNKSWNRKALEK